MSPVYLRLPTHQLETSLEMSGKLFWPPLKMSNFSNFHPTNPGRAAMGFGPLGIVVWVQGVRTQSRHSMQLNSVYLEIFCTFSKSYGFFVL